MRGRLIGYVAFALFVGTVWLANWLVQHYGFVSVGFGLVAPAGVYAAGIAFTLRDVLSATLGRYAVILAILIGAGLSLLIEAGGTKPGGHVAIAVASACAFLISELADLCVYEPLEQRGWTKAVVASNIVGALIDSAVFLWLAFGSLAFFKGQVVGKLWMTLAAVVVIFMVRRIPPVRRFAEAH